MNPNLRTKRFVCATLLVVFSPLLFPGCSLGYRQLRREGQEVMLGGDYGPARSYFLQARAKKPREVENLHDLGVCSVMLARDRFTRMNHAAAMRELDAAMAYYTEAIDAQPAHQPSLEGQRVALKLKGQFDEALARAEWAAEFIGPSAKQYMLLAAELEERGQLDKAMLRFRQAVALEPQNAEAHKRFAVFLLGHDNEDAGVYHLQQAYRADPTDAWVIDELAKRRALPTLTAQEEGS